MLRLTRTLKLAIFSALCAFPAAAQQAPLPAPITSLLAEMQTECTGYDSEPGDGSQVVTRADFNGDKRPDFLFERAKFNCPGAVSAFGGTNATGDPVALYLATPGGVKKVWEGGVFNPILVPATDRAVLVVDVICEPAGSKKSIAEWKICTRKLVQNPKSGQWSLVAAKR